MLRMNVDLGDQGKTVYYFKKNIADWRIIPIDGHDQPFFLFCRLKQVNRQFV